jgi:hypothetical protein
VEKWEEEVGDDLGRCFAVSLFTSTNAMLLVRCC